MPIVTRSPLRRALLGLFTLSSLVVATSSAARAQSGAPTITVMPPSGAATLGQQVSVTVEYCDNNGLDTAGVITRFNDVNVNWPKVYVIGNPGPCLARLTRTGTVTMVAGTNVLRAGIEDTSPAPLWSGWSITTWTTPVPWAGVTVVADNQFLDQAPSSASTQRFVVTNIGTVNQLFTVAAVNQGLASIGTPTYARNALNLAPGASASVTVATTSSATNLASGRVTLTASGGGESASAFTEIASRTPTPLTNGLTLLNPSGIVEKSICLTIAAGAGAAMECGDLRLAYALPGVMTMGKVRAPTLVYSAQAAHPVAAVPADLSITSVVGGETYTATVVITGGPNPGVSFPAGSWTSADWGTGGRRRILATFDAAGLATGLYPYRLDVQRSGGVVDSASGELLVVNRLNSYFNAGWWLAGLEQLVPFAMSASAVDTLLWVGGDGSARVFRETDVNSCVFLHEAIDRPDSIVGTPSGGACTARERRTSNGLRVVFDASGNHAQTINRIGEVTNFAYTSGRLSSIALPSGTVSRGYTFAYTAGMLDSVIAPATPAMNRAVKLTRVIGAVVGGASQSRITVFREPNLATVTLGYDGGSTAGVGDYRVVTRTNRMGVVTTFTYDASYRLAGASTPASATQPVTQALRAAEGQGKGTGAAGQALVVDSVYTRLDGPRADADASDISKWWVNRFGAPVRTRDPVGSESRIAYDAAWPALPATVTDAAGLVTRAYYNARGLVDSTVVVAPFGGANAVTAVRWNSKWDLPDSTIDANGIRNVRTYDVANGNVLTQRAGSNVLRVYTFGYDAASKQLRTGTGPNGFGRDSIYYDTDLGNLTSSRSPGGSRSWAYKDRLGRDTLVVTSVDTVVGTTAKLLAQRFVYDSAGRVVEARTAGPAMPYSLVYAPSDTVSGPGAEELVNRTTYDLEGRPLTVNIFSLPNHGVEQPCELHCGGVPMGTLGTFDIRSYDWLGRPLTQRLGSGPSSVEYDPAGNVTSEITRNGHTITSTYDAANRLIRRIVPSVSYGQEYCSGFAYGMLNGEPPTGQCLMQFPYYPNGALMTLVIPGDTSRFVFDQGGRMVRADNRDARISRTYFAAGAMRADTLRTRSYATGSFTTTFFGQTYAYDIGGRRTSMVPSINYSLQAATTYSYDADVGALSEVVQGSNRARFFYDLAGRQDSLAILAFTTVGVTERRSYDLDGQLTVLKRNRMESGSPVNLLLDSLRYDARGKIRRVSSNSASIEVNQQNSLTSYSGLGTVVSAERWTPTGQQWEAEQFRGTATGTVYWSRSDALSRPSKYAMRSHFGFNGELRGKGPLKPASEVYYLDTTFVSYDQAGNGTKSSGTFQRGTTVVPDLERYYTATRNYYGADNRLVVVQRYYATESGRSGAWEEFRYDALGRRVLSRTRRGTDDAYIALCSADCPTWIERTVWDGDQVLYEMRAPAVDSATPSSLDVLYTSGYHWGIIGYVNAGGIDKPLFTTDGRVPTYNWRGLPESSVWTNGNKADCSLGGSCSTTIAWPSANSIYFRPPPFGVNLGTPTPQWVGSVLADGVGSTGMLYRRNRYYDPATGQFTQQDPIGLAGGANVYGFAGGDPINGSDPFGLSVVFVGDEARRQFTRLRAIAGGMSRSRDESRRASGEALLRMMKELEDSDVEITLTVNRKKFLAIDIGNRTGNFVNWQTGLEGPGVNVSTSEFPGQPLPALLAHELGHAHYRWVQGGGPPSPADARNMNSATNTFSISMENMMRAAIGCTYQRPLNGHAAVTPCR